MIEKKRRVSIFTYRLKLKEKIKRANIPCRRRRSVFITLHVTYIFFKLFSYIKVLCPDYIITRFAIWCVRSFFFIILNKRNE